MGIPIKSHFVLKRSIVIKISISSRLPLAVSIQFVNFRLNAKGQGMYEVERFKVDITVQVRLKQVLELLLAGA